MKKFILYILLHACLWAYPSVTCSQQVTGRVTEKTTEGEQTLAGVNIHWLGTFTGTVTDPAGRFVMPVTVKLPAALVFSFVGYRSDTQLVSTAAPLHVVLHRSISLQEVNVERRRESTTISTINPIPTQVITASELKKGACCNLAESFETNPSVDVNYTDAVSGARQIQMLGLDGIYTQILSENLPLIHGLNATYGLGYIPGPFVESIYVSKGAGSVVNGYESITGQINVEITEPDKADKFFVNGYVNSDLRTELNLHYAQKVSKKLSGLFFIHGSDAGIKKDINKDNFMDGPLGQQLNFFNRWHFQGEKMEGQLGLRAVMENRTGGQTDSPEPSNGTAPSRYTIAIKNRQFEFFAKTGIFFPEKSYKSIGIMTSTRVYQQDMKFGITTYTGNQTSFYGNLIYQTRIVSDLNQIKAGGSIVYDDYQESFRDSIMNTHELIPGAFAEYSYCSGKKTGIILGTRADYHNRYGWFFTPRLHVKYNLKPETVFRLSAGSGFRTARIITENPAVFASSRIMTIKEQPEPEKAWNFGGGVTHKFRQGHLEGSVTLDYFHTRFVNQVVLDLENAKEIRFYNLDGQSWSNSYQVEFNLTPFRKFDIRLAYKRYDVKSTYSGSLLEKPFVPRDRVLLNFGYATNMDKWKFDATIKWFGTSRIPDTSENPEIYQLQPRSENYITLNAQITKVFRKFELYLGGENLSNYTQKNPILAAHEPFSNNFDASLIWGPLMGRVIFAGFRFVLN